MAGRKRPAESRAASSSKTGKRQVTKATFERWQRQFERDYQTLSWLRCELEQDKVHVATLSCEACKKYERSVQSLKNFSRVWITGSSNQKVSNVIDHATSEVHKASMARMRADSAKASGGSAALSTAIGRCLLTIDEETRARMRRKFDACYVMAKESMPFAKYPALLELEARHGVDLGFAYQTPDSAKTFTGYIAKSQRHAFLRTLSSSHFYSILMDGTTDAGNQEDELTVIVYCSRDDNSQEIVPCTRYLFINSPEKADAGGLLLSLGRSLKLLGVEDALDKHCVLGVDGMPMLVGGGTDGASVNVGEHNGLRGRMQQALPWLYWSWCYAHRLELACKDAFSSPLFTTLQEMLLRVYYIYEKSPKKSRELASIVDDLKEVFEFEKGGILPVRSHGTRWITHKRRALQRVVDRYGAYIAHLTTLAEDKSLRGEDRSRLRGYLQKWREPKVLIGSAMYVEALKPVSILSLTLQGEADIVLSIENTLKTTKALKCLTQKDPHEWPTVQLVMTKIRKDDDQEYQGVPMHNAETSLEQCKVQVLADLR